MNYSIPYILFLLFSVKNYYVYSKSFNLPILSNVGETKAVSAAYENSMPITAAEIFVSSQRFLRLKNSIY